MTGSATLNRVQDDRGRLWVESETISYPCLVRHGDHFFEAVNEIDLRILFALFKHWDRQ